MPQTWPALRKKIFELKENYEKQYRRPPTKLSFTLEDGETILAAPSHHIGEDLYPEIDRNGLKAVPPVLEGMEVVSWDASETTVS